MNLATEKLRYKITGVFYFVENLLPHRQKRAWISKKVQYFFASSLLSYHLPGDTMIPGKTGIEVITEVHDELIQSANIYAQGFRFKRNVCIFQ